MSTTNKCGNLTWNAQKHHPALFEGCVDEDNYEDPLKIELKITKMK